MRKILSLLFLASAAFCAAQQNEIKQLHIFRSPGTITVDGILDEPAWGKALKTGDFWQQYPFDSSAAITKTEVMVTYDDHHLHIAAICYDDLEGDFVIQSLKRDYSSTVSDGFFVFLDPYNDLTNGFSFGVNPLGVQREALIQYGGSMGESTVWDNKWFSEVKHYPDKKYWVVEIAIPFNTIRFKEKNKTWRINFGRNDLKRNERSTWCKVPRNFSSTTLSFTGELIWDEAPEKRGSNVSVIPYAISTASEDYQTQTGMSVKPNIGMDAKIAVSSSLNLDLTVNPDFAQVEVDRQVTNLSRFSLFFPERRNFFLENSDLFDRFGFRQIRPFFSRRIGLTNGHAVPILFGARLSGKLNRNWRIGLMNMQTEGGSEPGLQGQNYSVAAATYQLKGRSNISAIVVNRQGFNKAQINSSDYNRIAGLDWNIATMNNRLMGKIFFHNSFGPQKTGNAFAHASWLHYETPKISLDWNHEYVGNNYDAQVGFVPRTDYYNPNNGETEKRSYWRLEPYAQYKFYPKKGKVNNHGPAMYMSQYLDGGYKEIERQLKASYFFNFQNSAIFQINVANNFVKLFFDQDITFSGNTAVDAGDYNFNNFSVYYQSNARRTFNYVINLDYGAYYNGTKLTASLDLLYRKQPWGIFALSTQYNSIQMPEGFNDVDFWLIGPRIELSFTKSLFLTTFVQYNTQIENMNINTRLQWRFRPMSDLYVVYTENYNSFNVSIKNRALAVKLVWWINV